MAMLCKWCVYVPPGGGKGGCGTLEYTKQVGPQVIVMPAKITTCLYRHHD